MSKCKYAARATAERVACIEVDCLFDLIPLLQQTLGLWSELKQQACETKGQKSATNSPKHGHPLLGAAALGGPLPARVKRSGVFHTSHDKGVERQSLSSLYQALEAFKPGAFRIILHIFETRQARQVLDPSNWSSIDVHIANTHHQGSQQTHRTHAGPRDKATQVLQANPHVSNRHGCPCKD